MIAIGVLCFFTCDVRCIQSEQKKTKRKKKKTLVNSTFPDADTAAKNVWKKKSKTKTEKQTENYIIKLFAHCCTELHSAENTADRPIEPIRDGRVWCLCVCIQKLIYPY